MAICGKELEKFVNSSQTFMGFGFNGCYTMENSAFLKMFSHYIETGENYLDEYSEMTWLSWGKDSCVLDFEYFSGEERDKIKKWFNKDSFWDLETFLSAERIKEVKENIILSEAYDINKETYKYRRRQASAHTAKPEVRERVFGKHGKICCVCGSDINIEIDHIVPVVKGGDNADENLRPLCKNCNSSKGGR